MISCAARAAFYNIAGPAMCVSGTLFRAFRAPGASLDPVRVQLGPGQRNYLDGWINVDANFLTARIDVWADLRNALPFKNNTVDAIYSHHVIEHLPDARLPFHFSEMYRCLKPGGVFHVAGPNGDTACRKLVEGDAAWFSDFPDKRRSVGGRFVNFVLCRGEHLTILSASYLQEIASDVGFEDLQNHQQAEDSGYPEHFNATVLGMEWRAPRDAPDTLVMEGKKPG